MPAKVKVRILAGRNLPVMDKSSDASDAFVEVKLGNTTYKTEVYRRSLNPFWNSEWFRFEVNDQELQDEPLQIRIMDYDTYSANDAIGKVYINLNPLLVNPGRSMSGWLPIYDTLHGIRGEINCMVKVNLFADNNRFRHSSCGVRFFFSDIPNGYKCDAILGFVDELLVNDDPEYQWIDKIRTPRASNEARQTLFTKLSGEVQRKLGLKAEIFGGNAVIGYQQSFDLEGGSGIVGRGIGTAVILSKIGYPYEGIISPLHTSNSQQHYPYKLNNRLSSNQSHPERSATSQSFIIHNKNPYPDRHLVHSVSADYFYEVPTSTLNKKLFAATLESSKLSKTPATDSRIVPGEGDEFDSDDDMEYVDCEEISAVNRLTRNDGIDYDSDLDEPSAKELNSVSSSSGINSSSIQKIKTLTNLSKSLNLMSANSLQDVKEFVSSRSKRPTTTTKRKLSATSLINKLRQSNEQVSEKLANVVVKPISNSSSIGLTKLLSFRKPQSHYQLAATTSGQNQKRSSTGDSSQVDEISKNQHSARQQQSTDMSNTNAHSIDQQPTFSEDSSNHQIGASSLSQLKSTSSYKSTGTSTSGPTVSSSSSSTPNITTPSSSNNTCSSAGKRRRDKSQSASIEDALSIIEEKLDDDDNHLLQVNTGSRPRLLSGSSGKLRQMLRATEIDLTDDMSDTSCSSQLHSTGSKVILARGTSSADDEYGEESASILSSSTLEAPPPIGQAITSESLLSSSSPSSSILTDETIKAAKTAPTTGKPLRAQLSSPAEPVDGLLGKPPHPSIRRSDTDIADKRAIQADQPLDIIPMRSESNNQTNPSGGISRSRMASASPDPKHSLSTNQQQPHRAHSNSGSGSNFAQSVRIVKAQQHLLQNIVKIQNQNLVAHTNRVKNVFMYPNGIHQSEYPFVTLKRYPDNMIQCTGGVVSVHSVKLLDHIINDEESETRDIWWTEIRKEIRSHAKALNCNTILGYSETSKVLGDVCVLSACGTAALLKPIDQKIPMPQMDDPGRAHHHHLTGLQQQSQQTLKVPQLGSSPPTHSTMPVVQLSVDHSTTNATSTDAGVYHQATSSNADMDQQRTSKSPTNCNNRSTSGTTKLANNQQQPTNHDITIDCSFCHTPLICVDSIASLASCTICKSSKVPDVLLLTIEPPNNMNIVSQATLIQARVCRAKRDSHGEASAKEIGDALPFLECELHRQLFSKLKFKGMNCLFNLSIDISVGENMLTGLATGTGCFVLGLPTPEPPKISAGKGIKTSKLNEIQRLLALSAMKNRETLGLKQIHAQLNLYHENLNNYNNSDGAANLPSNQQQPGSSSGHSDQPEAGPSSSINNQLETSSDPIGTSTSNLAASPQAAGQDQATGKRQRRSSAKNLKAPNISRLVDIAGPHNHTSHHRHHKHHKHHTHHGHGHHYNNQHPSNRSPTFDDRGGDFLAPTENLLNLLTDHNNIVLEVDDNEDADIIALLIDSDIPDGYLICNSESLPAINQSSITSINMFTQVMRAKLAGLDQFAQQFDWILQALFVKLRRSLPCCLTNVNFVVDLPESHIVQISVTGCLLGLQSSNGEDQAGCNNVVKSGDQLSDSRGTKAAGQLSTSSMSPSSTSTSSSNSSLSPTSSSAATTSSSSKSSSSTTNESVMTANDPATTQQQQQQQQQQATATIQKPTGGSESTKSSLIPRQLSKTNLAALLTGGKSSGDRKLKLAANASKQEMEVERIELAQRQQQDAATSSTKATIAAVKQEIKQNRLGSATSGQPVVVLPQQQQSQLVRPVFKKQLTYPGATSPAISGQDKLLPSTSGGNTAFVANDSAGGGQALQQQHSSGTSNAARRATIILNKVKQPLRDLGSNFNSTSQQQAAAQHQESTNPQSNVTSTPTGKIVSKQSGRSGQSGKNHHHLLRQVVGGVSNIGATTSDQAVNLPTPPQLPECPHQQRTINSSIDITSLSYIPGAKEYHYLGNLSFSFVRETNSVRENGGLNGFIHCFLMEVYAIVRAHVSALGGNALLSFRLQQSCIFYHSNKNQAQCLISVAGDAAQVTI